MSQITLRRVARGFLSALTIAVVAQWLWLWEQRNVAAFAGPACQVPPISESPED